MGISTLTRACPRCRGAGKVPLSEHLLSVLRLLERKSGTAIELRERAGGDRRWAPTAKAFNNRLEELRGLGLVTREKVGREWVYGIAEGCR